MRNCRLFMFALSVIACVDVVHSAEVVEEDANEAPSVTLEEAIISAYNGNIGWLIGKIDKGKADEQLQQAKMAFLPDVHATMTLSRSRTDDTRIHSGQNSRTTYNTDNGGNRTSVKDIEQIPYSELRTMPDRNTGTGFRVDIRQNLFNGFSTLNTVHAAEHTSDAAFHNLRMVEQKLIVDVFEEYADVWFCITKVSAYKKMEENMQKLLAYVAFIFLLHSVFFGSFVAIARNLFISSAVFFDKISYCIVDGVRGVVYALSNDTYGIIFGLKKENLKLKNEVEQLANLKIENDELRKMLSMKERIDCDVCIARVLRSFSNDYVRSFILDLGESDGISLDDVVINNDGLIGRIVEVDQNWSKVMLITDTNSNVPVRASVTLAPFTASRSSETYVSDILTDGAASTGVNASAACTVTLVNAIAAGDNTNTLKIPMVYEDVSLKNGDIVETSGYGNVFHDRIPVGKVVEEENGTFCIVPFADFNAAEYVGVLKKNK